MLQNIKSKLQRREAGFTIIEVALVLAIAGLIFLVVFLALPALQKSQRDTARRQDVGEVVSALQTYSADNQGSLSTLASGSTISLTGDGASGLAGYVGKASQLTSLIVRTNLAVSKPADMGQGFIVKDAKCNGNNPVPSGTTDRNAAVVAYMEGSQNAYCQSM